MGKTCQCHDMTWASRESEGEMQGTRHRRADIFTLYHLSRIIVWQGSRIGALQHHLLKNHLKLICFRTVSLTCVKSFRILRVRLRTDRAWQDKRWRGGWVQDTGRQLCRVVRTESPEAECQQDQRDGGRLREEEEDGFTATTDQGGGGGGDGGL